MELDIYQQAWKSDAAQARVSIDTDLLTKEIQRSRQAFRSTIFWRDAREIAIGLLMIPVWIYMGIAMALPWTWYLEIPAVVWIIGYLIFDRRRHPQNAGEPSESLLHCSKESLRQVEHQIWLLRNVFWWYLLPSLIAIMSFFVHVAWRVSSDWWMFLERLGGPVLIGVFVNVVVYLVNRFAIRFDLEPRRQELLNLVASLEDESNGTDSKDIIVLVSKLADPTRSFTWESWADNWNRIVPSWPVAAAILFPTLLGACCGLYSGLFIRIPEMGPVFFQTVVGAVIPFEVAIFSNMYLAFRRKTRTQAALASDEQKIPASGVVLEQSDDHRTKRLPKPPALAILVLTLFVGIMAIFAVVSAFLYFSSEHLLRPQNSLVEPSFGDVNGFGDGFAKVAPFTGVRWEKDRPVVCVNDVWSPLVSIDGIPIDRIMEFANKEFDSKARKRFAEDLVELLSKFGHDPDWKVTLGLEKADGQVDELPVLMTKANRELVWIQGNQQ